MKIKLCMKVYFNTGNGLKMQEPSFDVGCRIWDEKISRSEINIADTQHCLQERRMQAW
jgi:hypothetical protein